MVPSLPVASHTIAEGQETARKNPPMIAVSWGCHTVPPSVLRQIAPLSPDPLPTSSQIRASGQETPVSIGEPAGGLRVFQVPLLPMTVPAPAARHTAEV